MEKMQLREKLQKCLLEMSEQQRNAKSKEACRKLTSTPQFQNASTVMLYLSLPYEADAEKLLAAEAYDTCTDKFAGNRLFDRSSGP